MYLLGLYEIFLLLGLKVQLLGFGLAALYLVALLTSLIDSLHDIHILFLTQVTSCLAA